MLPGQFAHGEFSEMDPFSMVISLITFFRWVYTDYLCSKPCFVIASKVLMREISRVRQVPPSSRGPDYTPPNTLIDKLDKLMDSLTELAPAYPVIGKSPIYYD